MNELEVIVISGFLAVAVALIIAVIGGIANRLEEDRDAALERVAGLEEQLAIAYMSGGADMRESLHKEKQRNKELAYKLNSATRRLKEVDDAK